MKNRRRDVIICRRRFDHGVFSEIRAPKNQRRMDHPWIQPAMAGASGDAAASVCGRDSLRSGKTKGTLGVPLEGDKDVRPAGRQAFVDEFQRKGSWRPTRLL